MLRNTYRRLKQCYLDSLGYHVPTRYQSAFVHWGGGAEVQYIYKRMLRDLPKGARVLVVGVMGGRDYFLFRNLGFDVTALDLGPQPDIEDVTIANIEEPLPFEPESFDAVLAGEVLEHLRDDVQALVNIRRSLKADGRLLVSLPFYNDWDEGHMRIHSPTSGMRLLQMGGFEIDEFLERPGLIPLNLFNPVQHGISLLSYGLTRKTAYPWLTRFAGKLSWRLGKVRWLRPLRRMCKHYGGYYLGHKSEHALDYVDVNRSAFTMNVDSAAGTVPSSPALHRSVV